jgi:hypothetical protein
LTENQQSNTKQPDNVNQVLADNQKLKSQLMIAKKAIEEYKKSGSEQKSLNDKLGARVASIEMERRKDKIANILTGAYKPEELDAKVESFAKSGLPFEEIHSIVSPLAEMLKAANEQAKSTEINTKAEELAKVKSASLPRSQSSKVAIKNAATPAEEETHTEIPAWAVLHGGVA